MRAGSVFSMSPGRQEPCLARARSPYPDDACPAARGKRAISTPPAPRAKKRRPREEGARRSHAQRAMPGNSRPKAGDQKLRCRRVKKWSSPPAAPLVLISVFMGRAVFSRFLKNDAEPMLRRMHRPAPAESVSGPGPSISTTVAGLAFVIAPGPAAGRGCAPSPIGGTTSLAVRMSVQPWICRLRGMTVPSQEPERRKKQDGENNETAT